MVRVNHNRHGCSVISTVIDRGEMRWMVFKGALNSSILIGFLISLVKDSDSKIFLVSHNLRVHHRKPVKTWLAEHVDLIGIIYLPSYSPELNPVEVANAALKDAVTKHAPVRKEGHLELFTSRFLRSLQRQPKPIIALFQKDSVRYAVCVQITNAGSINRSSYRRLFLVRSV